MSEKVLRASSSVTSGDSVAIEIKCVDSGDPYRAQEPLSAPGFR